MILHQPTETVQGCGIQDQGQRQLALFRHFFCEMRGDKNQTQQQLRLSSNWLPVQ